MNRRGFLGGLLAAPVVAASAAQRVMPGPPAYWPGQLPPTQNYAPGEVKHYIQIFRKTMEITRTSVKCRIWQLGNPHSDEFILWWPL